LDRSTGAIFLLRNVIFEKGTTHLVELSIPTVIVKDENLYTTDLSQLDNDVANQSAIAPRPLLSQDLHDHELTKDELISPEVIVKPSLAMRRV